MANQPDVTNMALFCDFENIALGVRDARYDKFDIKKVLERLLLKGSIVVKKAYCDWDRYKAFKGAMHEANFELIEIPHLRMSGKNSADIRMVVDALDLCYTKEHVDTFVIISGDSDFSPLVSKLRENDKTVIGVGVKNSTSDLLIANCDEFIYYDDLVRERKQAARRAPAKKAAEKSVAEAARTGGDGAAAGRRRTRAAKKAAGTGETASSPEPVEPPEAQADSDRVQQALDLVIDTIEALAGERGGDERIWGSMVKQAIKRVKPGFAESYYGFRSFNALLEEAAARGLVALESDPKSGGYVVRLTPPA